MNQIFLENTEYEILTPNGWESFDGIIFNKDADKPSRQLTFADNSYIKATLEHRFFINGIEVCVSDVNIGDRLDSVFGPKEVINLEDLVLQDTFEIFNAKNHVILANDLLSHQCDEFAFLQPHIAEAFWSSISPTLATGGKAIITSTPNSDEDQFATMWKEANDRFLDDGTLRDVGTNGFFPYSAHWSEHPDRDEEWAKIERGRIGEEKFRREYGCEFLIYDETLIDSIKLSELKHSQPIEFINNVRWYKEIDTNSTYCVSLDPSLGTGGNYAGIQIFEMPSMIQVGEWHNNTVSIQHQVRLLKDICKRIAQKFIVNNESPAIYYTVENNNIGEAALMAINEVGEESIPGIFMSEPVKRNHVRRFRRGLCTTHGSKLAACAKLKQFIENKMMIINSDRLISQLKLYVANSTNSYSGKGESPDDLVSAALLAVRMMLMLQDWDETIFDRLNEESMEDLIMPMPFFMTIGGTTFGSR